MPSDFSGEKQQLHELVDRLAPGEVRAVCGLLKVLLDPVARAVANAPVEDEPITADEAQALGEARDWLKQNKPIPHDQVLAELGFTEDEVDSYKEPA